MAWLFTERNRQSWLSRLWWFSIPDVLLKLVWLVIAFYSCASLLVVNQNFFSPPATAMTFLFVACIGSIMQLVVQMGACISYDRLKNSRNRKDDIAMGNALWSGMVVFVVIETVLIIWAAASVSAFEQGFRNGMQKYIDDWKNGEGLAIDRLRVFESLEKCCGVNGKDDYISPGLKDKPPDSCCTVPNCNLQLHTASYHSKGCLFVVYEPYQPMLITFILTGVVMLVIDIASALVFRYVLTSISAALKTHGRAGTSYGYFFGKPAPFVDSEKSSSSLTRTHVSDGLPMRVGQLPQKSPMNSHRTNRPRNRPTSNVLKSKSGTNHQLIEVQVNQASDVYNQNEASRTSQSRVGKPVGAQVTNPVEGPVRNKRYRERYFIIKEIR